MIQYRNEDLNTQPKDGITIMNTTKNILIFYSIVLICLCISSSGVYILDKKIGLVYAGSIITITPILTILTIIISTLRSKS